MRFFKQPARPQQLGSLESHVMETVWSHGDASVRDVAEKLNRPLAYTTVMTTLDRLYKKGLLDRRKADRAFVYSPRLTRSEWERRIVADMLPRGGDLLISCLLDEVGRDAALLDELERKIKLKREELDGRKS